MLVIVSEKSGVKFYPTFGNPRVNSKFKVHYNSSLYLEAQTGMQMPTHISRIA